MVTDSDVDNLIASAEAAIERLTIPLKLLVVAHRTIERQQGEIEEARNVARRFMPIRKPEVPIHDEVIDEMIVKYPWLKSGSGRPSER